MNFLLPQFGFFLLLIVHNTGVISGSFMNSGAVRCGNLVCRQISGIFSKTNLQNGYIHVATIPAGASNISITEMKHSMNLLVLKSADHKYVINGDYTMSMSGIYDVAGTTIDYRRIDGITNGTTPGHRKIEGTTEWITCTGPTTESIYLLVLFRGHNPGIKYEYLLPIHPNMISNSDEERETDTSSSESDSGLGEMANKLKSAKHTNSTSGRPKRKRQFLWKVVGFNSCSKSCGGGVQTPIIRCVREAPTRIFSPKRCAHLKQPVLNDNLLKCNQQPCPAYWKTTEWSDCNCDRNGDDVYRFRELKCIQELATGMLIQVNNGACLEDAPLTQQKCECPKYLKTPETEVFKHTKPNQPHHHTQSELNYIRHNVHTIPKNHTQPKRYQVEVNKRAGVWLTSDWNEQCTSECGTGVYYRTMFCDRSPPNIERCDLRVTPDATKQCQNDRKCNQGDWFLGPWSTCIGDCFNLKKTRQIYCMRNEEIVSEGECNISEKPETEVDCLSEEVKDCRPKWHYSEWTSCTKTCDGGTQKRTVKCFEPNIKEKQLKESQGCRYAERPTAYRNCNTHSCSVTLETTDDEEDTTMVQPRVDMIQNDETDTACKDTFSNCNLVIKASLCNYNYYNEKCCLSCKKHGNDV